MEIEMLAFEGIEGKRNRLSWKPSEHTGSLPRDRVVAAFLEYCLNSLFLLFSIYIANSRRAGATQRGPFSKNKEK